MKTNSTNSNISNFESDQVKPSSTNDAEMAVRGSPQPRQHFKTAMRSHYLIVPQPLVPPTQRMHASVFGSAIDDSKACCQRGLTPEEAFAGLAIRGPRTLEADGEHWLAEICIAGLGSPQEHMKA